MTDNKVCCDLLEANLKSMEAILKAMKIVTSQYEHIEMRDSISEIEKGLVHMFEQVELVQEISDGVYKVIEENDTKG